MDDRRTYSDDTIAQALALLRANGGNAKKTARQLNVPRTTLRQWNGAVHNGPPRPKPKAVHPRSLSQTEVQDASAELAQSFEDVARAALGPSLMVAIEDASFRDRMVGAGIATDKMQLLRGFATSRTESLRISLVGTTDLRNAAMRVIDVNTQDTEPQSAIDSGSDTHSA